MKRRPYLVLIMLVAAMLVAFDKSHVVDKLKDRYGYSLPPHQVTTANTRAGDIASGALIDEGAKELLIDTKPCTGKTLTFHQPYKKKPLGTVTCNGRTLDNVEVRQE